MRVFFSKECVWKDGPAQSNPALEISFATAGYVPERSARTPFPWVTSTLLKPARVYEPFERVPIRRHRPSG